MTTKTINTIIFDLDGVLVDTCEIHFIALNKSIAKIAGETFIISDYEHNHIYNGLSTKRKLELLTENKNLPTDLYDKIHNLKQDITNEMLLDMQPNIDKIELLQTLKLKGYKLYCASNCIRSTVDLILSRLKLLEYFENTLSNADVLNAKPSPDIYLKILFESGCKSDEALIFEDSYIGLSAAIKSGCNVCPIKNSKELTLKQVQNAIQYYESKSYGIVKKNLLTECINIVIPMAGDGSRFSKMGYSDPKPLIDVFGLPMISWVIRNIGFAANYTYIVKSEHLKKYNLNKLLNTMTPGCNIVTVDSTTEGAACTVLLSKSIIDNNNPLLICNSDQFIEWDCFQFVFEFLFHKTDCDAVISTFNSDGNTKWSYAKLNKNNLVECVAEKQAISGYATTGFYLWRSGSDFVKYAEQMIAKNIRVNNEFYVCPVFNEAINDNKKIVISNCERMWGLGVPEDLDYFHSNFYFK